MTASLRLGLRCPGGCGVEYDLALHGFFLGRGSDAVGHPEGELNGRPLTAACHGAALPVKGLTDSYAN